MSNNEAEYEDLIAILKLLVEFKAKKDINLPLFDYF